MSQRRYASDKASSAEQEPVAGFAEYREQLAIDRADLDECLEHQPELLYHAAEQHVLVTARRDAVKLDLEEVTALLAEEEREDAERAKERITATEIRARIQSNPEVCKLKRKLVQLSTEAGRWQALENAFKDRSKMLTKLVDKYVSDRREVGFEKGADRSRYDRADAIRQQAGQMRRERARGMG